WSHTCSTFSGELAKGGIIAGCTRRISSGARGESSRAPTDAEPLATRRGWPQALLDRSTARRYSRVPSMIAVRFPALAALRSIHYLKPGWVSADKQQDTCQRGKFS